MNNTSKTIRINHTDSNFRREKLIRPFGFKGGYLTELWQVASMLQSESGNNQIGVATQSVLYGDADLFASCSEAAGNALMFGLTDAALQAVKKAPFRTPMDLMEKIIPEVKAVGTRLTGRRDLNENFVYNALVGIDNAAWLLYASENNLANFDDMIPAPYKQALSFHNEKIAVIYLVSYGMPLEDLKMAAQEGYFIFKVKTGYPGSQEEMLEWDMARLTQIHSALKEVRTGQTENGKVLYTMDANGRYEKKETLLRYLDHAEKIGAFDQILLYEEPLSYHNEENVSDTGLRICGDESIHDEASALRRLDQGYGAIVLKGIAKTLSLTMQIAKVAYERRVPCLCADLTVNPILIDWHKNLAARLAPFPGLGMGLMETNGALNYQDWQTMTRYHPMGSAPWTKIRGGAFGLGEDFYQHSGGIFEPSSHYQTMFQKP